MNGPTILDGLHSFRCGSFRCVRVILDAAKICMHKHKDFIHFYIFGRVKHTYSRIQIRIQIARLDPDPYSESGSCKGN